MMQQTDAIRDSREREKALDPSRSFIVQAPAGSGKTELLIQRFLTLLAHVDKPEQILAITFTRKAAGEMHSRIMDSLVNVRDKRVPEGVNDKKTADLAHRVLEKDEKMKWDLLGNPGRLKVQTIDSFCASLTKQMPILSRLGGTPFVSDAPDELYTEAAQRTISMVNEESQDGEALRTILRHLDNSMLELENRLTMMLRSRDQWMRHLNVSYLNEADLRNLLELSIKRLTGDILEKVREAFHKYVTTSFIRSARYAASNLVQENSLRSILRLRDLSGLPDATSDDLQLWKGIAELLLTGNGMWRKPGGVNKRIGFPSDGSERAEQEKIAFREILESLAENEELLKALNEIKELPNPNYDDEEWTVLYALLDLLPVAVQHLMQIFREKSAVDFQEVSMAAVAALGTDDEPTDLMLSLDLKIQHILVDEYQDTSLSQVTLLTALTRGWECGDGRTLFLVGDPMQSIYLFRGAEVGLFLNAKKNGLNSLTLSPLTLNSNFRSHSTLVEWINDSFKEAFPEKEDIFKGAISFVPSRSVRPGHDELTIDICLYQERNDVAEAEDIVSVIDRRDNIDNRESFAILARSRAHLDEIVKAFKRRGVNFKSQDLDPLMNRPVIQDLFSLLRALMHPCDRVAWLAVLRAPWCGLTLSDLHRICIGDRSSPVWASINDTDRVSSLSGDGQNRVVRFADKCKKALAVRGRVSPRKLIEGLWIELGGPATVHDRDSMDDSLAFFDVLDSVSVAGEVVSLQMLQNRIENLYANHSSKRDGSIEIMTIHKAKGLEFDHVIIPGLGKKPRTPDKRLLFWMERGDKRDDLLFAPIEKKGGTRESAIYRYLSRVYGEKESLEQTRLFYVAATRARKKLYLFGHIKGERDEGMTLEPQSFLSTIAKSLASNVLKSNACRETGQGDENTKCTGISNAEFTLKRLPTQWKSPSPENPVVVTVQNVDRELEKEGVTFFWAGGSIKHLGTVIHRYLCRIAREGLARWNIERVTKERNRIAAQLQQLGLNNDDAHKMSKKGVEILFNVLRDKWGRWILHDQREAVSEMPVTGVLEGAIIHAIIDRTFVDDDDIRWVIDYKVSFHEGGLLQDFLESEKERYKNQLEKYAALLTSGGEKRTIKKALYHPALSTFTEI